MLADTKRDNELSLNETGKSPLEIFAGIKAEIHCDDFHTWGCTVFILAEENHSGLTGTPKWEPRARTGVYLGHSPTHEGNVALVLNLQTGHVSPQYHLVFDDDFTTVKYIESGNEPPNWCKLVQDSSARVTDEQYYMARTWYTGEDAINTHKIYDNALIASENTGNLREQANNKKADSDYSKPTTRNELVDLANLGLRRSGRKIRPSAKLKECDPTNTKCKETVRLRESYGLLIMATDIKEACMSETISAYHAFLEGHDEYLDSNFDGTNNSMSIIGQIYLSGKINNEIYTLKEMMQQPDRIQFEKAMHEEVKEMFDNDIWTKVSKQSMFTYYDSLRRQEKI